MADDNKADEEEQVPVPSFKLSYFSFGGSLFIVSISFESLTKLIKDAPQVYDWQVFMFVNEYNYAIITQSYSAWCGGLSYTDTFVTKEVNICVSKQFMAYMVFSRSIN